MCEAVAELQINRCGTFNFVWELFYIVLDKVGN